MPRLKPTPKSALVPLYRVRRLQQQERARRLAFFGMLALVAPDLPPAPSTRISER